MDIGELRTLTLEADGVHNSLVRIAYDVALRSSHFNHRLGFLDLQRLYDRKAGAFLDLLLDILVMVFLFILITDGVLALSHVLKIIV